MARVATTGSGWDHTKGPTLITDLAVWRPPRDQGVHRDLLHRGVTRDMVQETCGWRVRFANDLEETPVPSELELGTLRDLQARTAAAHARAGHG